MLAEQRGHLRPGQRPEVLLEPGVEIATLQLDNARFDPSSPGAYLKQYGVAA